MEKFKKYYGSASIENKKKTGQQVKNIEGISIEIPCNNKVYSEFYEELKQAVQSSCSYAGSNNLMGFNKVRYGVFSK